MENFVNVTRVVNKITQRFRFSVADGNVNQLHHFITSNGVFTKVFLYTAGLNQTLLDLFTEYILLLFLFFQWSILQDALNSI